MDSDLSPDELPKSKRFLKILAIALAGLFVLLIAAYFVLSSSAFLKGSILPRVGKALNAEITVDDASLSPFSSLTLTKLKVQGAGADPVLTADLVRVRYSLLSILKGNYVVNEMTIATPNIQVVKEANGTSNLDPLTKGSGAPSSGSKSGGPMRVALRNLEITDGTVRFLEKGKDGAVRTTQLGQINARLDRFENGEAGKLSLATGLRLENRPGPVPGRLATNDLMEGKLSGQYDFKVDQKLLPQSVNGNSRLDFSRAEGAYAELGGLSGIVEADMTPSEIRQLVLRFERGGQALGRVRASGPLDLAKSEGRIKLEVQSIDRQVLNLVGASRGWDFGPSTLNATNDVDITRQGDLIGAKGTMAGRQLSIRQGGQVTPALDLDLDYEVTVNRVDQAAVIKQLTLTGRQQQKELLRASLDRPMTLAWAPTARGFTESAFQLAVQELNLADWRAVLGTNSPTGRLDLQLTVVAKQDGKELTTKGTGGLKDFSAGYGTNRLEHATVRLGFEGVLQNFKLLSLQKCQLEVQERDQPLFKFDGSGSLDLAQGDVNLQANAEIALATALTKLALPDAAASKGVARLNSAITKKGAKQTLTGNLFLGDFTGRYGSYVFDDYQASVDYNVSVDRPEVQIHSASLSFRKGFTAGGTVGLSGNYQLEKKAGQLNFKVVDLNQIALGPILAPSLGTKKLVSISMNGSGSANYDPKGDAALKADLSLTNWVVADPQAQFVSPKLSAQTQLDGSMRQQVLDLRQCLLKLAPTARAKNELEVKAKLDFTKTNASPSQITVQADSLDITPYYEMFAGNKTTTTTSQPAKPTAAVNPAGLTKPAESAASSLPFEQLRAQVKIGGLYLREVVMTNLTVEANLNGGQLSIRPCSLSLNGAAVSAEASVNMAVPDYTYDVSFKADRVPIEPLANSFSTNAPGQFKGDLIAQGQLKGAGLAEPKLQKNLSGSLSLNLTNLNYEIVGRKTKRLLEPISIVLGLPELLKTPLNWIEAKAGVGQSRVDLQQFIVQSAAFYADSRGSIPLADVLTNSPLNLPVNLSLRRTLAEKAHLLPANAPTNAVYVQLPSFVTLNGTLGDPKSEVNKIVLGGLLVRSIGGMSQVGDKAGTLLQGLGGVLSGQQGATAKTNSPAATNASQAGNIVGGISSLFGGTKKERAPTNAAPAATGKSDLLKLLPEKK